MNEKDIKRFNQGDKYIKSLLRPELEEEVKNLNSWLPEYERYCDTNLQDAIIRKLVQKGRERLKILKMLLEQDFYERIWNDDREKCPQCGWILQESYGCYMSFLVCKNPICGMNKEQGGVQKRKMGKPKEIMFGDGNAGISIEYVKSKKLFHVFGWYGCTGLGNDSTISLKDFCNKLGITEKDIKEEKKCK